MTVAHATNAFGLSLWRELPAGNNVISPASLATTLAMVWTGARGKTAEQLAKVLHLESGDADRIATEWGALASQLRATGPLTLRIANRLYGQSGYDFVEAFRTRLATSFVAPMEIVDFARGVEPAINAWIAAQTENKITNLLAPGVLDAATRLVLVNAIYFLGKWADPFEKQRTHARPFWLTDKDSKHVPTMHRTGSYELAPIDDGFLVELPYRGGTTAMYIARPDDRDGLAKLERRLTSEALVRALDALETHKLELALPRFVADPPPAKLNAPLAELGMKLPFDPTRADFTAMASPGTYKDELYLAAVFHKAFVKTDEEGTVAAAATAAAMAVRSRPKPPEQFYIDRPFLFLIVDKRSKLVLFVGRIVDPS